MFMFHSDIYNQGHKNRNDDSDNSEDIIKVLSDPKNKVFIFFYKNGCPYCEVVHEEWNNLNNILRDYKNDLSNKKKQTDLFGLNNERKMLYLFKIEKNNINNSLINKVGFIYSFPTFVYLHDGLKERYENETKRKTQYFIKWLKNKNIKQKNKRDFYITRNSTNFKGGKWSLKYKKSINCLRPKGFSQKQYCKYGRKKNKKKTLRNTRDYKV